MRIKIIAAGQKQGFERALYEEYTKRLSYSVKLIEITITKNPKTLAQAYLKAIVKEDLVILLDETGENLSSPEFAKKLEQLHQTGKCLCFIIGEADGIPLAVKSLRHSSIAFGKATWPHLLVRALLAEQLYRAQQISLNHPYHRG